jgi:hypothetical protein
VEPELPEGYEYVIDHTPWGVAEGEDIVLSLRESDDGRHTRRVLRWHSGVKEGTRRLSISLVHQRRSPLTGDWHDQRFNLVKLKAGEEVSLDLDADQTRKLIEHLDVLRQINDRLRDERGSVYEVHRRGEVVVTSEFAAVLKRLMGNSTPEDAARSIALIEPDLAEAAGIIHQHRVRSEALGEFKQHLDELDWAETRWQAFFKRNDWIFGHGMDYRFLVTQEDQPHYGGSNITGRGDARGDFFMGSVGDARFAVLVELKTPGTDLLGGDRYRNGAWRASNELAGGVAQLQANCQQWLVASHSDFPNIEWASERDLTTAQPKGILLIGRLSEIAVDREQRESFERFRRHLWNPEVITYDELYERAAFIVARTKDEERPGIVEPADGAGTDEWDDLPF